MSAVSAGAGAGAAAAAAGAGAGTGAALIFEHVLPGAAGLHGRSQFPCYVAYYNDVRVKITSAGRPPSPRNKTARFGFKLAVGRGKNVVSTTRDSDATGPFKTREATLAGGRAKAEEIFASMYQRFLKESNIPG